MTFEPGCRNSWHIHHAKSGGGQILICIAGRGYYQEEGKVESVGIIDLLPERWKNPCDKQHSRKGRNQTVCKKNFLFADTIEGAKATSMWFSLIISARMNHLDAEKYLIYVLDQLSASETITEKLIERCLPYSNQLPVNLKM